MLNSSVHQPFGQLMLCDLNACIITARKSNSWLSVGDRFSEKSNSGDHLCGKPGNVTEFDNCRGSVGEVSVPVKTVCC